MSFTYNQPDIAYDGSVIRPVDQEALEEGAYTYTHWDVVQEDWAIEHEQIWHREALQKFGEKAIIRRRWTLQDFDKGLVTRCARCQGDYGDDELAARLTEVYKGSTSDSSCAYCYGVGYEGGFEPLVYAMHILAVDDSDQRARHKTGEFIKHAPRIQLLWAPTFNDGDLIVQGIWDGNTMTSEIGRYQMGTVTPMTVRAGNYPQRPEITVAQQCDMRLLPREHPYYSVPLNPDAGEEA